MTMSMKKAAQTVSERLGVSLEEVSIVVTYFDDEDAVLYSIIAPIKFGRRKSQRVTSTASEDIVDCVEDILGY